MHAVLFAFVNIGVVDAGAYPAVAQLLERSGDRVRVFAAEAVHDARLAGMMRLDIRTNRLVRGQRAIRARRDAVAQIRAVQRRAKVDRAARNRRRGHSHSAHAEDLQHVLQGAWAERRSKGHHRRLGKETTADGKLVVVGAVVVAERAAAVRLVDDNAAQAAVFVGSLEGS